MKKFDFYGWLLQVAGLERFENEFVLTGMYTLTVLVILLVIGLIFWRATRDYEKAALPSPKVNLQNIVDLAVENILKMLQLVLGNNAERFLPLLGSLFIYIFVSNMLGFIPGFESPTMAITTDFACAIVIFVYYNYIGIKEQGLKRYLKSFMGPVIWLAPLIFCIELITNIIRPVSLAVRLFGNMTGDHLVVGMFTGLVPLVVPVIFMLLGVFIAFIQAFVFAILSAVYISLALGGEEAH